MLPRSYWLQACSRFGLGWVGFGFEIQLVGSRSILDCTVSSVDRRTDDVVARSSSGKTGAGAVGGVGGEGRVLVGVLGDGG